MSKIIERVVKSELLLIGLKNQLAKIHNFSLNISHCARNLGFIFDEHLYKSYPPPIVSLHSPRLPFTDLLCLDRFF